MLPKFVFIACGGTIGGEWDPSKDTVVPTKGANKRLHLYLKDNVKLYRAPKFIDLFNKDSRQILDKDRDLVVKTILEHRARGYHHFIITHGTFTMTQTGAYLDRALTKKGVNDVCVVITGSMIPNTGFAPSDAQFNMGFAIGQLAAMNWKDQGGVYVSMNGYTVSPTQIKKNVKAAKFEKQ
jgi:L-asparaginase/Glu-tRNA(Gln) amidotransferase subunit D